MHNIMKYLPSRKASEILGVHPNTLRNWAKSGTIEHIKAYLQQHDNI
jgi:predicted site-specific integrase-resolvase